MFSNYSEQCFPLKAEWTISNDPPSDPPEEIIKEILERRKRQGSNKQSSNKNKEKDNKVKRKS